MVSYTPKQKFQVDDSNLNVVVNDAHRREFISYDRLEGAHVRTSDMSDSSETSTGYSGPYQGTFFSNKYFTLNFNFILGLTLNYYIHLSFIF